MRAEYSRRAPVVKASPRLGLPEGIRACLFDLDGVLTETALLHAVAWKETFDALLLERSVKTGSRFVPFASADYDRYVDGRPRDDGSAPSSRRGTSGCRTTR